MARIYHTDRDDGEVTLVWLRCDDCGKKAKPGDPEMLDRWIKMGFHSGRAGDSSNLDDWIYCGTCKREH